MSADDQALELLRAEAAYSRARLARYNARVLNGRASSLSKLHELERAAGGAAERLHRAELAHSLKSAPPPPT